MTEQEPKDIHRRLHEIVFFDQALDILSPNEQVTSVKEMIFALSEYISENIEGFAGDIASNYLEFEKINPREKPPGAIRIISPDLAGSFNYLLDQMRVPPEIKESYFFSGYPDLMVPMSEQTPDYTVYISLPVNPMLKNLYGDRLTDFKLLSLILINTNTLGLTSEDRLKVLLKSISFMCDFYTLAYAIQTQNVHIGALNDIYDLIELRSSLFILRIMHQNGQTTEDIPDLESAYKVRSDN